MIPHQPPRSLSTQGSVMEVLCKQACTGEFYGMLRSRNVVQALHAAVHDHIVRQACSFLLAYCKI